MLLSIQQSFVKWDKLSTIFLVVIRKRGLAADKENEFTKKEDLLEHVKYLLGKCGMLVSVLHIQIHTN